MTKERSDERYEFRCHHCGKHWVRKYRVQRAVDHDGRVWVSYRCNGLPAADPTGHGTVACPACGAEHVYARRVAFETLTPTP